MTTHRADVPSPAGVHSPAAVMISSVLSVTVSTASVTAAASHRSATTPTGCAADARGCRVPTSVMPTLLAPAAVRARPRCWAVGSSGCAVTMSQLPSARTGAGDAATVLVRARRASRTE
ncbi:hypothetical protein AQI70_21835 [Streptomyces curacoi]|uniref:Uncharacterized protein n=1 Tax=Streptomyces curacoi TaxID=146536 RepID=A0A124GZU3_9ACTN|nr:hypothetical protein AQI70_21835 [Streptomyces curacoi]